MRGSLIKQIGGLSDELFLYWEEADWCYSAKEKSFESWYEPRSVIYHNFKSAHHGKEKPFYMYMQTRNAFIFAKRHYRGLMRLRYWLFYPVFLVYRFFSLRRMGNPVGARAIVWGFVDAMKGFSGTTGLAARGFNVE
jgi:GT2 family glycosyltransferase